MKTEDPVLLALASIGAGAASGAGVMTAGLVLLRTAQTTMGASEEQSFMILTTSVLLSIFTTVVLVWKLTAPIQDYWRRGVSAAIGTMLSVFLAGISVPAEVVGGRIAMVFWIGLLGIGAWYSWGNAVRAAQS